MPAVLEVSPSPVYGARLLSGLRANPSRGFKSRHLRRTTAPDPFGSGAVPVVPKNLRDHAMHSHEDTRPVNGASATGTIALPQDEKELLHDFKNSQARCCHPAGSRPDHGQRFCPCFCRHGDQGTRCHHQRHGVVPQVEPAIGSSRRHDQLSGVDSDALLPIAKPSWNLVSTPYSSLSAAT